MKKFYKTLNFVFAFIMLIGFSSNILAQSYPHCYDEEDPCGNSYYPYSSNNMLYGFVDGVEEISSRQSYYLNATEQEGQYTKFSFTYTSDETTAPEQWLYFDIVRMHETDVDVEFYVEESFGGPSGEFEFIANYGGHGDGDLYRLFVYTLGCDSECTGDNDGSSSGTISFSAEYINPTYQVDIFMRDSTETLLANVAATVIINEDSVETTSGKATYFLENGDYDYTVVAEDYETKTGSFSVIDESKWVTVYMTTVDEDTTTTTSNFELMEKLNFEVYPNPSKGTVNIKLANAANVAVLNTAGVKVFAKTNATGTIALNGLKTGLYIVTINNKAIKVIVE